jgi:peptidyl-prolyl cis-trans isomerase B (cyclophilin B)
VGAIAAANPSDAQLTPQRVYSGVGREVPMTLSAPPGEEGVLVEVELLRPGTGETLERATVGSGTVDLATVFPSLWRPGGMGLVYAQAVVNGRRYGPAVVVQPMLSPRYAPRVDRAGLPIWTGAEGGEGEGRVLSGVRTYVDQRIVFETDAGEVEVHLRPDAAPNTAYHVRELVAGGFYTDIPVHRIASLSGGPLADIVQFGDPTGTGRGGPGFFVDLEDSALPQGFGVVSLARGADANSGGSQVFIGLSRVGTASLDGRFAAFGQVVRGGEVLQALARTPVNAEGRPAEAIRVRSARLVNAPPYPEGTKVVEPPATVRNRPER